MNPWLLLIIPIASAVIIQLGLKRNATASALLSTLSVASTFIIAYLLLGKEAQCSTHRMDQHRRSKTRYRPSARLAFQGHDDRRHRHWHVSTRLLARLHEGR